MGSLSSVQELARAEPGGCPESGRARSPRPRAPDGAINSAAMDFIEKATVMDAARIDRALSRLASEIVELNRGIEKLVLVGIRRRGVPLAERIAEKIAKLEGTAP